jgi:predicted double-glycine peptidase
MCRTVNINDEIIVVSEGKKDIGKLAVLGNDGKFDPSVIPVIDELQDQISKEVSERIEGDKVLQTNIDAEASTRANADRDLQDQITKEVMARTEGDKTLQTNNDTEVSARTVADQQLQDQINKEVIERTEGDKALHDSIDAEVSARTVADQQLQDQINKEVIERTEGDKALQNSIDAEVSARAVADQQLQDQINKEATERTEGDKTLQTNIDAEVNARTVADQQLQDKITAEITARNNADETESTVRLNADQELQNEIDALKKTMIPSGIIVAWSGAVVSIPSGWNLCDGSNGTPNLCDKFILGAGSCFATGTTGGEEKHALTIDEMPIHEHTHLQSEFNSGGFDASNDSHGSTSGGGLRISLGDNLSWNGIEKQNTLSSSGNNAPHNNMPPYYALAYIMKMA